MRCFDVQDSMFSTFVRTRFDLIFRNFHSSCPLSASGTDFYTVLGINRDSDSKEIRSAYLKLCKQYHPDTNPNQTADSTRRFQEINEAYSVLSDSLKRRDYDLGRMNPMANRTSYHPYQSYYRPGFYQSEYHRPFENEDYYKKDKGYQAEYERMRRHEEGIRSGRIKPVQTTWSVFGIILGIMAVGVFLNVMRALSIAKLLDSNKELTTHQLREFRRIQFEMRQSDGLSVEERLNKSNNEQKPEDK